MWVCVGVGVVTCSVCMSGFVMCGFVYVRVLYCVSVCMFGFCNVCVCVGGVNILVFGNCVGVLIMCTGIYCVFVLFRLCIFIFICY